MACIVYYIDNEGFDDEDDFKECFIYADPYSEETEDAELSFQKYLETKHLYWNVKCRASWRIFYV